MNNFFSQAAVGTAATIALAATVIAVKPANAQTTTVCQSIDYQPATCSLDTRGGVVLDKEYSNSICADNWGFEDGFVWVENGCRARFRATGNFGFAPDRREPDPRKGFCPPENCPEEGEPEYSE
ncbi:hypothetical protein NIES2119_08780 [[Phormidium ambiguum] IAM M-71]|uniref:DUF3011 domain-containing protein n=1 Tax=[Phormidium ambiguum] IAM M-71 TaxID=454136 RepID=A0A1U7IN41_9CYAN|nr:DUF3011 domain-containing protein [Phormidium ambiguum]OKH38680.1 hypothetical protein NIES2119_08780 [Phormidium ambiguum IAM M-71]